MGERIGDWLQTYQGIQFYPLDPKPEDIRIDDIAHALSMKCRYNGHCKEFYSVAQHSVLVAEECLRRKPGDLKFALWGLLHDAAEAYLPDIPRPIKRMDIGILKECEENIMRVIAMMWELPLPEPVEVKRIDNAITVDEQEQLMGPQVKPWRMPEPKLGINIDPKLPGPAKEQFYEAYYRLMF